MEHKMHLVENNDKWIKYSSKNKKRITYW